MTLRGASRWRRVLRAAWLKPAVGSPPPACRPHPDATQSNVPIDLEALSGAAGCKADNVADDGTLLAVG